RLTVLGRGTVLGRPAVRVEVPFERAEPLFPFLSIGGDWRPFFPNDRVRIWLDERNWFPLRWDVYPATGAERDAWALRFGLPDEPSHRSVFSVHARHARLDTHRARPLGPPVRPSRRALAALGLLGAGAPREPRHTRRRRVRHPRDELVAGSGRPSRGARRRRTGDRVRRV